MKARANTNHGTKEVRTIDIGKEERTIIVEPAQEPVPAKKEEPARRPAREREPEKVPTEK